MMEDVALPASPAPLHRSISMLQDECLEMLHRARVNGRLSIADCNIIESAVIDSDVFSEAVESLIGKLLEDEKRLLLEDFVAKHAQTTKRCQSMFVRSVKQNHITPEEAHILGACIESGDQLTASILQKLNSDVSAPLQNVWRVCKNRLAAINAIRNAPHHANVPSPPIEFITPTPTPNITPLAPPTRAEPWFPTYIVVFHDGENCPLPRRTPIRDESGSLIKTPTGQWKFSDGGGEIDFEVVYRELIRRTLSGFTNSQSISDEEIRSISITYNFILAKQNNDNPFHPSEKVLSTMGSLHVLNQLTDEVKDAVDRKLMELMEASTSSINANFTPEARRKTLYIVISGDRDYATWIRQALQHDIKVAIVYSMDAPVNRSLPTVLLKPNHCMGIWTEIVEGARSVSAVQESRLAGPFPGAVKIDFIGKALWASKIGKARFDDALSVFSFGLRSKIKISKEEGNWVYPVSADESVPIPAELLEPAHDALKAVYRSITQAPALHLIGVSAEEIRMDEGIRNICRSKEIFMFTPDTSKRGSNEDKRLDDRPIVGPKDRGQGGRGVGAAAGAGSGLGTKKGAAVMADPKGTGSLDGFIIVEVPADWDLKHVLGFCTATAKVRLDKAYHTSELQALPEDQQGCPEARVRFRVKLEVDLTAADGQQRLEEAIQKCLAFEHGKVRFIRIPQNKAMTVGNKSSKKAKASNEANDSKGTRSSNLFIIVEVPADWDLKHVLGFCTATAKVRLDKAYHTSELQALPEDQQGCPEARVRFRVKLEVDLTAADGQQRLEEAIQKCLAFEHGKVRFIRIQQKPDKKPEKGSLNTQPKQNLAAAADAVAVAVDPAKGEWVVEQGSSCIVILIHFGNSEDCDHLTNLLQAKQNMVAYVTLKSQGMIRLCNSNKSRLFSAMRAVGKCDIQDNWPTLVNPRAGNDSPQQAQVFVGCNPSNWEAIRQAWYDIVDSIQQVSIPIDSRKQKCMGLFYGLVALAKKLMSELGGDSSNNNDQELAEGNESAVGNPGADYTTGEQQWTIVVERVAVDASASKRIVVSIFHFPLANSEDMEGLDDVRQELMAAIADYKEVIFPLESGTKLNPPALRAKFQLYYVFSTEGNITLCGPSSCVQAAVDSLSGVDTPTPTQTSLLIPLSPSRESTKHITLSVTAPNRCIHWLLDRYKVNAALREQFMKQCLPLPAFLCRPGQAADPNTVFLVKGREQEVQQTAENVKKMIIEWALTSLVEKPLLEESSHLKIAFLKEEGRDIIKRAATEFGVFIDCSLGGYLNDLRGEAVVDESQSSPVPPPTLGPKDLALAFINNNVEIRVIHDSLLNVNCDVVVNAANARLNHAAGIAFAISKQAGPELNTECQAILEALPNRSITIGDAVVSGSYNLKSSCGVEFVVHAVGPIYTDLPEKRAQFKQMVLTALRKAQGCQANSIGIPLMGAGVYGWPPTLAASLAVDAINDWIAEGGVCTRICLVDIVENHANAFKAALLDCLNTTGDSDRAIPSNVSYSLERKFEKKERSKEYRVLGLPGAVEQARSFLLTRLEASRKLRDADISVTIGTPIDVVLNNLQADFHNSGIVVDVKSVVTAAASRKITLDLYGENNLLCAQRVVTDYLLKCALDKPQEDAAVPWPVEWSQDEKYDHSSSGCKFVEVAKASDEWVEVEEEIRTCRSTEKQTFNNEIVSIHRVQNPSSWAAYYFKVRMLASKLKAASEGESIYAQVNECLMKHGTRTKLPESVASGDHGLDLATAREGVLGFGVYTYDDASVADKERHNLSNGDAQLLLVRVAAGNIFDVDVCTRDHSKWKMPPIGCNTVRGNAIGERKAMVVYQSDLAYPAYLITYKPL